MVIIPSATIAGLMMLVVVPKPLDTQLRTTEIGRGTEKEKPEYDTNYQGLQGRDLFS